MEQAAAVIQRMKSTRFSPTISYDPEEYECRKKRKFQEELKKEIEQKKAKRLQDALERSGLINAIKTKTFDSYVAKEEWQKRMKRICEEYAENPKKWLFVSGPSGCGKTHLCTAIVGELAKKNMPVWYMLYREEIEKLKSNSWTNPEEREKLWKLYTNAETLYIDDLFQGGATRTDADVMFALIDYRYRENKRTIISTELKINEIGDIRGAIAGRISEMSRKALVKDEKSRDYRMKGSAE